METNIAVFRGKEIRKTIYKNEWWFSIVDVVEVLSGTDRPRKYWNDLKNKLTAEGYVEVSEKIGQLKMQAPDGKMRETDCANTEILFRIIQSIPSRKAEPFKRWLANVGYERVIRNWAQRGRGLCIKRRGIPRTPYLIPLTHRETQTRSNLDSVPLNISEQKPPGMPLCIRVRIDHRYKAQPPDLLLLVIKGA